MSKAPNKIVLPVLNKAETEDKESFEEAFEAVEQIKVEKSVDKPVEKPVEKPVTKPAAVKRPKYAQNAAQNAAVYIIKLVVDAQTNDIAGMLIVDMPYKEAAAVKAIADNWGSEVISINPGSITQTPAQVEAVNALINQITLKKVTMATLDQAFGRRFGNGSISSSIKLS